MQRFSPRFSRAELCRRAGISDTTFLKGLRAGTKPRPNKRGPVSRELETELERLTPDQQAQVELVIEAERLAAAAGITGEAN